MAQLSQTDYRDIGIMVHRFNENLAFDFLKVIRNVQPELTDISLISDLFAQFCDLKNISGINSKSHTKTEYVYLRHVFIAVIIKLYNPELLSPHHQFRMIRRLREELSRVLKVHVTWVSQNLNTVCVRLNVYDDFSDDVKYVVDNLKY